MELKYHGGDLGREIAFPIKKRYRRNLERKAAARGLWMEIWEEDSLLPVMQIGRSTAAQLYFLSEWSKL